MANIEGTIQDTAVLMADYYLRNAESDNVSVENYIENHPYGDWLFKYSILDTQEEWNDCMDLCDKMLGINQTTEI